MRAFLAFTLPELVQKTLSEIQNCLAVSNADVKWVKNSQLHVTIKFLDEITTEQQELLQKTLEDFLKNEAPIVATLGEIGSFGSSSSPRIIWVGLDRGRDAITRIAVEIEKICRKFGFRKETKPFTAHVTLGRIRSSKNKKILLEKIKSFGYAESDSFTIKSLTFFQSVLTSSGPKYTVLSELPLGK